MFEMRDRFDLNTAEEIVQQRLKMIQERVREERSIKEIVKDFNVSRTVFYKHLKRYKEYGKLGLCNVSRAPLDHGRKTKVEKENRLIKLYQKYPFFSSYELNEMVHIPPATIQRILKRKKLKKVYKPKAEKKKLLAKLKKEIPRRTRKNYQK